MKSLLVFWDWLRQALFPDKCLICAEEGFILCPNHAAFPVAEKINLPRGSALNACLAVTDYNCASVKAIIKSLKFHRQKRSVKPMVQRLRAGINWSAFPNATLIPIPIHWRRRHWRGFNQTELLAESLKLEISSISLNTKSLTKIRATKQQAVLTKADRRLNQINVFRWDDKDEVPKTILLLDDVMTTGSTLESAARVLKRAGAKTVIGIIFAYQSVPQKRRGNPAICFFMEDAL